MSIPTAVFLDTSIFDGQQYNFQSTALSTFVPVCAERSVNLLLPDPTEREIKRHMMEWSQRASKALEEARRKAPFLAKWKGLPTDSIAFEKLKSDIHMLALGEWGMFLHALKVVRLDYQSVDMRRVMDWYDRIEPPFRDGPKRKEFPDAFALAMLEKYAKSEKGSVAVVSEDPDFKAACERFDRLLYFQTLPRLTEVLLSDDARIGAVQSALDNGGDALTEAVFENLAYLSCYHVDPRVEVQNVEWEVKSLDTSIVGLGDGECTVAFYALLDPTVILHFYEETPDGSMHASEHVRDEVEVEGTAKLSLEPEGKISVRLLSFDEDEVKLRATPWSRGWF